MIDWLDKVLDYFEPKTMNIPAEKTYATRQGCITCLHTELLFCDEPCFSCRSGFLQHGSLIHWEERK